MSDRASTLLVVITLALVVCGCENPDYSGAKFKPTLPRPDAYKTAVKGYVFERRPEPVRWGNAFLHHARTLAEREYREAEGAVAVLDEVFETGVDENGLFGFQNLTEGFHSLRIRFRGRVFRSVFHVERNHLAMVALEIHPAGYVWASQYLVKHTFLTNPLLKDLLRRHQRAQVLVDDYAKARLSRSRKPWSDLLSLEYADGHGGREDFIRAQIAVRKGPIRFKHEGFRASFGGKRDRILLNVREARIMDFHQLELEGVGTQEPWKIRAVRL